jgi:hypothetical protein
MTKRKRIPKLSDEWLGDVWTLRPVDGGEDELANFDQIILSGVTRCLESQDRAEIADSLSLILGQDVPASMLDAYASEAKRGHNIPAFRSLALIGVAGRFDVLDALVREVGGKVLSEPEVKYYRIGKAYVDHLNALRALRKEAGDLFGP